MVYNNTFLLHTAYEHDEKSWWPFPGYGCDGKLSVSDVEVDQIILWPQIKTVDWKSKQTRKDS